MNTAKANPELQKTPEFSITCLGILLFVNTVARGLQSPRFPIHLTSPMYGPMYTIRHRQNSAVSPNTTYV